jgi:16S rRNA (uracil1498-N3)-methyltransferase
MSSQRRFYAPAGSFDPSLESVVLSYEEARHLRDVLRLRTGDTVFVFDGQGREYECAVAEIKREHSVLRIISEVAPARPESSLELTLAAALLKGEKFDLVVQKTTELGVHAVVPVVSRFSDIHLKDERDADRRLTRWRRIALEAAKQSGRARIPEISLPINMQQFLRQHAGDGVLFSERLGQSFEGAMSQLSDQKSVTALVGSEGGWSDDEINNAREWGWRIVTLGGRTLRAETAALTVVALLQHRFGDLK